MRDWVETLIAHELAYSYLSKVFYEPPTKELIGTLAADELFDAWPLESDQPEVETGLGLLRQFCASWSEDGLESLQQDYLRLFVGPGRLLAAPWESVVRNPDHLMFGQQTVQVRRLYERFGMSVPHPRTEPEDHIGLELRFVAHLCAIGVQAIDKKQPDILDAVIMEISGFLEDHLLQWAPECLRQVIENAKTDYYRGAAYLALGCLNRTNELVVLETAR